MAFHQPWQRKETTGEQALNKLHHAVLLQKRLQRNFPLLELLDKSILTL